MKRSEVMLQECACTLVRTASRLVTRSYDEILKSSGLKASQLSVLAAADATDEVSIAALSKRLHMDRTTLTRNLKPLIADGLVVLGAEGWRRSKVVRITSTGQRRLEMALPLWEKAQASLLERMGQTRWQAIGSKLRGLVALY